MISFEKGEETRWDGIVIMDGGDFDEWDSVRICKSENPYQCIASIQANYLKHGVWTFETTEEIDG